MYGSILVQAYFVTQACPFVGIFRHNFAENDLQDLNMGQKDASRNSTQSVIKKNQLINKSIEKVMAI